MFLTLTVPPDLEALPWAYRHCVPCTTHLTSWGKVAKTTNTG